MFEITLEHGATLGTMLLVAAAAVLLAGVFYWRAFGALRPGQWQTLFVLRVLAILIVVLLLFRPVVSYYRELEEKRAVVFLLDTSASMGIADGTSEVSRFEQARQQVAEWWAELRDDFDPHLVAFAERARPLEDVSQLAALAADGRATSLSRALVAAVKVTDPEGKPIPRKRIEAVILVSDGIHNSARDPRELAGRMGTVVYTVGVGASLRSDVSYRDIQLVGMECPERLMLNNMARITASVEAVALDGRVVQVLLKEDGQTIGEQELTLDGVEGGQQVTFEFRPTATGRHTYEVEVPTVAEEKIEENNARQAVALVVEPGIRVLYIEGTLRAEFGALADRFLAKDPDLEFCALVQTRPNHFLRRTNIEGLEMVAIPTDAETINTFDVFIIGDLDSSYLRPEVQRLIVQRIRAGAGLIMLGGYHSLGPGGYGGTPIGDILPVLLGDRQVGQVTDSFLPQLTPEGVRHPVFANIAPFFPTSAGGPEREGLPPLEGATRVEGAKPAASVLATCPLEGDMPVMAVQPVGRGRTAVFCGDTTRNWQQGPRAMGQESPFLQFWGQFVRWAAGRGTAVEAEAGVVASTDKGYYEPDEPIRISAVVRDERGEGTAGAAVVAQVRGPSGRSASVQLTAVPGPAGHYGGTFEPDSPGTYQILVEAKVDSKTVRSEEVAVEVGRPNLEFEKLDLDEERLAELAELAGGRYFHITTASRLIDELDRTQRKRRQYHQRPLFSPPWFWALFVGLLTTEWILRRRFQLR
ncbi:MAG TPA: hypothetical protein EYH34_06110 [Planctomycetes bacterium]|nr:hypothetical protein [Planctomycetota bacterium]